MFIFLIFRHYFRFTYFLFHTCELNEKILPPPPRQLHPFILLLTIHDDFKSFSSLFTQLQAIIGSIPTLDLNVCFLYWRISWGKRLHFIFDLLSPLPVWSIFLSSRVWVLRWNAEEFFFQLRMREWCEAKRLRVGRVPALWLIRISKHRTYSVFAFSSKGQQHGKVGISDTVYQRENGKERKQHPWYHHKKCVGKPRYLVSLVLNSK